MGERTRALVRDRAGKTCEYCKLHQDDSPLAKLHIEPIVAKKHGGTETPTTSPSPASTARDRT